MNYSRIDSLKENPILKKYFIKPKFIDSKNLNIYVELLKKGYFDVFIKKFNLFLKKHTFGTNQIKFLFIYLEYLLEKEDIFNKKIIAKICVYFFSMSRCIYLGVYNKEIINYIKQNSNILSKHKSLNIRFWDKDYYKLIELEDKITTINKNTGFYIKEHFKILNKKFKKKEFTKKIYLKTVDDLRNSVKISIDDYLAEKNNCLIVSINKALSKYDNNK